MDEPLLFLTSTSSSVPSGRNARAAARASLTRSRPRPTSAQGTFIVFPVKEKAEEKTEACGKPTGSSSLTRRKPQSVSTLVIPTLQEISEIPHVLGPQSIHVPKILDVAITRIRRDLVLTLKKQPSCYRDILRRRQWAAGAFASGEMRLTPEVYSAVQYLEQKLLVLNQSGAESQQQQQVHAIELQKYGVALIELQRSLRDPERRMQPSVLAASHMLAVCELLDDITSINYLKFVDGIVTLSNLQACRGDSTSRTHILSRGGAILVEALLTKRMNVRLHQSWSKTLLSAGENGFLPPSDARSLADSTDLIFSEPFLAHASPVSQMTGEEKRFMLSKACSLHSVLKKATEHDLLFATTDKYTCSVADIIRERLAVMLGLDDLISQLAEGEQDPYYLVHADNDTFYADVIATM